MDAVFDDCLIDRFILHVRVLIILVELISINALSPRNDDVPGDIQLQTVLQPVFYIIQCVSLVWCVFMAGYYLIPARRPPVSSRPAQFQRLWPILVCDFFQVTAISYPLVHCVVKSYGIFRDGWLFAMLSLWGHMKHHYLSRPNPDGSRRNSFRLTPLDVLALVCTLYVLLATILAALFALALSRWWARESVREIEEQESKSLELFEVDDFIQYLD